MVRPTSKAGNDAMRKKNVCCNQPAVTSSLCVVEEYMLGEIDFECWGRLWKASPSDPDVDAEEWFTFSEGIEKHCRTNYKNFPAGIPYFVIPNASVGA